MQVFRRKKLKSFQQLNGIGFFQIIINLALTLVFFLAFSFSGKCQILFLEECFQGGVSGAGFTATPGSGSGTAEIRNESNSSIKKVYAITHRYGRPPEWSFEVNNSSVFWNEGNQIGPEMVDGSPSFQYFAVNIQDITETVDLNSDVLEFEINYTPITDIPGEGWFSIYILVLYHNDQVGSDCCVRIYTADQSQDIIQNYLIDPIEYSPGSNVGFAIFTDRLTGFFIDRSRIRINNILLGEIFGADSSNPEAIVGTRGHFYYENGELFGLDDDIPNTTVSNTDAIAVINEYLIPDQMQEIEITKVLALPTMSSNAHPAFFITYTPDCPVASEAMPRYFDLCARDTAFF